MGRKTYRRKHSRKQKGGGCGCGGSSVLGFPQNGGQMNSIIGSPNNSVPGMNSSMNSMPVNSSMNSMPVNSGMNSMPVNSGMNSMPVNSGMNSMPVNSMPVNSGMNNSMSFNNGKYNNKSNIPFSGGFLGMFESPSQPTTGLGAISSSSTPTNTGLTSMPNPTMNPPDVNTRVDDLEKRLRKLETGGGFFGGGRQRRKRTRKHKSRKH